MTDKRAERIHRKKLARLRWRRAIYANRRAGKNERGQPLESEQPGRHCKAPVI